jgi:hypothetical protein
VTIEEIALARLRSPDSAAVDTGMRSRRSRPWLKERLAMRPEAANLRFPDPVFPEAAVPTEQEAPCCRLSCGGA